MGHPQKENYLYQRIQKVILAEKISRQDNYIQMMG
jgi:hypothetical protein